MRAGNPNLELTEIIIEEQPERKDMLSDLPMDILLQILKSTSFEDALKLAQTSKKFNAFIHKNFLNTTYGEALRYMEWQEAEIKLLEKAMHQLETPPTYFAIKMLGIMALISCLAYIQLAYTPFVMLMQGLSKGSKSPLLLYTTGPLLFLLFVAGALAMAWGAYEALSPSRAQRRHLLDWNREIDEAIKKFIRNHQKLFAEDPTLNPLQPPSLHLSSLSAALRILETAINNVKKNAEYLNQYLLERRSSYRNQFSSEDVAELAEQGRRDPNIVSNNFGNYAQNMFGFWMQNIRPQQQAQLREKLQLFQPNQRQEEEQFAGVRRRRARRS